MDGPSAPRLPTATRSRLAAAAALARPTIAVSAVQCAEDHGEDECRYRVAWSINPRMAIGAVEFAEAAAQHGAFVAALEAAGAAIVQLPFVHGAYDSVFVKDAALLLARRGRVRALLARLRHPERQPERLERARSYAQHGFEIAGDDHGPSWEGGDVVMLPSGEGMFFGYGWRSRLEAGPWLERHAGVPVWPLELCDPSFYHLDMALAVLPDGTALVYPAALTPGSLRIIEQVRGVRRVIRVSREAALSFALNLVPIGDTVVLGGREPCIEALVSALGYRVVVAPVDQFHLAGGSAACLVATVHRDPQAP